MYLTSAVLHLLVLLLPGLLAAGQPNHHRHYSYHRHQQNVDIDRPQEWGGRGRGGLGIISCGGEYNTKSCREYRINTYYVDILYTCTYMYMFCTLYMHQHSVCKQSNLWQIILSVGHLRIASFASESWHAKHHS